MTRKPADYAPLTTETLPRRLAGVARLVQQLGADPDSWTAREVGDGNLNLVFIVQGPDGAAIVKQALPYVRLVGDSWPLPLRRAWYEYNALIRQGERAPGMVPEIYHFDEAQAIIAMQFLSPHVILRKWLIAGKRHATLADDLGRFAARTLFRGSDLSMPTAKRKADVALFAESVALNDITETLVFTDPYFKAERNHHTPGLDDVVARLRADVDLKVEAQHLKMKFANHAETMLHGDFHTGSVMVSETETKVIDPEFVLYGPMGFDMGMLLANFWMVYFTMPAHIGDDTECAAYQEWLLKVTAGIWDSFCHEFTHLWRTERTGMLYEPCLFEDQGQPLGAEQALSHRLSAIWQDALGFAGIEILRRILSLAHNEENESIADEGLRADCEARELALGRQLIVNRCRIGDMARVNDLARRIAGEARA